MRQIKVSPVQSVERAIQILNCFSFEHHLLNIDTIVQKTGLAKTTAYRLLWTLEKNGLIEFDPKENGFHLSYKMIEYGGIALEKLDIRKEAESHLEQLHQETGFEVLLAIQNGETLQYILTFDSEDGFQPGSFVGKQRPLTHGALGTILMAYLPEKEAKAVLEKTPLEKRTPYTVTDKKKILERLLSARKKGYYIDEEETYYGITAISAPLRDRSGTVRAAMAIAGPSFQFQGKQINYYLNKVLSTAAQISQKLGYTNE
jgi:DNA-binding IclR family transcriptional regulator